MIIVDLFCFPLSKQKTKNKANGKLLLSQSQVLLFDFKNNDRPNFLLVFFVGNNIRIVLFYFKLSYYISIFLQNLDPSF